MAGYFKIAGLGWMVACMVTVMATVTTACSEDSVKGQDEVDGEPVLVTFNIGTPESGEVEYTRASAEAGNDKKIESLKVYDFLVTVNGSNDAKSALISRIHYLKKVESDRKAGEFTTEYNSGTGAMTATFTLSLPGSGDTEVEPRHIFAIVANEGSIHFDSIARPGVTPIDSLLYCFSNRKLKDGENCDRLVGNAGAVMTALTGELAIEKNMALTDLPPLCRIVARVDVANNVLDTRNLKIVGLSARYCAPRGYLFGRNYAGASTTDHYDYKDVRKIGQNTAVQKELEGLQAKGICENVLYLYEQPLTRAGVATPEPVLLLSYTLNGAPRTMEVPLRTNGNRVAIERNRKYKLIVGSEAGVSTRVVCTVATGE